MLSIVGPHWDAVYAGGDDHVSWSQPRPAPSLEAIAAAGLPADAPVIDVGGGSSGLAGELLAAGHRDVTVLDLSPTALALARTRLGDRADRVTWIAADVLAWTPPRRYALWHDRALLHFFTREADRAAYAGRLRAALAPGGVAVIATFSPDGPETCSGLPVRRAAGADILALLGEGFTALRETTQIHTTPGGRHQPFTWLVARR